MEILSHFNFQLRYRPGRQNSVPDHLSRRIDHKREVPNEEKTLLPPSLFPQEQHVIAAVRDSTSDDFAQEIYVAQAKDPLLLEYNMLTESERPPEGWHRHQDLWFYKGKIYISPSNSLRQRLFHYLHSSPSAAHPGRDATLEAVRRFYFWSTLRQDIERWVRECDICQRMKIRPKKPHGFLKPIDVTPGFWEVVTSDLITGLPPCKGFDAIWTATDKRGKMKHVAPTTSTLDSLGLYHLYLDNVWKHHGTSKKLITDRGPQFSSQMASNINKHLGIEMALSTAYHPQTDGQSERTNQEVEQALRTLVSYHQDDWVDWLPVVEFALNNRFHKGLQTTPFYANYGFHPRIGSLPQTAPQFTGSVDDFLSHLHKIQLDTKECLENAAADMKRFYDRHRLKTPEYEIGQQVLLDNSNLAINQNSRKLAEKRSGPFKIEAKVGTHAYRISLPSQWKHVHPVFHVSKLEPYHEDPQNPNHPRPPPDVVDDEPEWEVEEILDSKFVGKRLKYFVKWLGWPHSENSWQDESDLENAPDIVQDFHSKHPQAPCLLPDGTRSGNSLTKKTRSKKKKTSRS